jgi:hypothetical protein
MYNNTRCSLLLVTLFHVGQQLFNNLMGVIPTRTDEMLMWFSAIVVILLFRRNDVQAAYVQTKMVTNMEGE